MQLPAWNLEKQVCKHVQSLRTVRGQCGRACRLGSGDHEKGISERGRARGHDFPDGEGQIKPLSDFVPKVGITAHLSRYRTLSLVPAPEIPCLNLLSLRDLDLDLGLGSSSPNLLHTAAHTHNTHTHTATSPHFHANRFTYSTSAKPATNYLSRSLMIPSLPHCRLLTQSHNIIIVPHTIGTLNCGKTTANALLMATGG